ncbi:MAG: DUF4364 family protein [Oscillibacter sp.]|nr:DUF4364 family protein [Oscillibacter sp.]
MAGFIHDTLEVKFLILYLAARLAEPVPFDTLLDLALCDDGVDYFAFSECLRDLVSTEHLSLSPEGRYAVTEKGARNSKICEDGIPYSVRLKCDRNVEACNRAMRRERQVRASWDRRRDGTCALRLALDDDLGSVMDLRLTVPREELAQILADRFRAAPERIYTDFLSVLMGRREEKP